MKKGHLLLLVILLTFAGCMKKALEPVKITIPERRIDYLTEVKPILDKRCVVCHSCYNSPCQLKLSSYEGVDRGATKKAVYKATRLETMDPTRLFVDARNSKEWRKKDFFSVTESSVAGDVNDSLMLQLLSHKMHYPKSSGEYKPEEDDLTCSKNSSELASFLDKHPNRGMPFGFPPLEKEEFDLIAGWLVQGASGPGEEETKALVAVSPSDRKSLADWESFFNLTDPKHRMTARYLYEHLFLAHIRFGNGSGDFYELVRSRTPPGKEIDIIATVRPYDNPGGSFYYRFRKIHSTIVKKTHMVFTLDDRAMHRYIELFIEPEWLSNPTVMNYDSHDSADPFFTFEQIPPKSRYQFLLDNAHYILMTFIRGPVCKGQVALNVINDQFWIFFLDPEADLAVKFPGFLRLHREQLRMPAETGSDVRLLKAISNPYHRKAMDYFKARQDFYAAHYFNGMGYDAIWVGEKEDDAPLLTVLRHFDSASVHKGALGDLPKTLWVMDYPLLERIYYSLVAGFDVFGNAWHQLKTRLYMDALRREGEANFLDFLPQQIREETMKSWYLGMDFFFVHYQKGQMPAKIHFKTDDPKREIAENLIDHYLKKETGIRLDLHNYLGANQDYPEMPQHFSTADDVFRGFQSISRPGPSFFTRVTDYNANVAFIRVRMEDGDDVVLSAVINRWHDNVTFLFSEKKALASEKDNADFYPGFIGSYPNYFFNVSAKDLPRFLNLLRNYRGTEEDSVKLSEFGINRGDNTFWDEYDWFQTRYLKENPVTGGLFDLNRYYYLAK